ncbi:TSC22 domain family protein 4 [Sardina pilchardus]|uniref:TSC22 domain family protein 4 n=1 Tax=Sardina pilchardus TaxID=27697 RepID=UPI002E0E47DA
MSGGKKKSGFQITSVTSDYSQWTTDSPSGQNPAPADGSPAGGLSNGGQSATASPSLPHRQQPTADRSSTDPAQTVPNGPSPFLALSPPSSQTDRSSSQPATPVLSRRQSEAEQQGSGGGSGGVLSSSGGASRFRVVRLGQGLGEPYRRGRWTCVDQLERPEPEPRLRRVLDSMRHAHSLESLETVGLESGGLGGAVAGAALKPLGLARGLRGAAAAAAGPLVHSQGTSHLLAHQQQPQQRQAGALSGPPSPTHASPEPPSLLSPPTPRTRNIPPPLRLDMDATGKFRMTQSQPSSPGSHLGGRDGLFHPSLTPIQTPSALALAQSMFGVGGCLEDVGKVIVYFLFVRLPVRLETVRVTPGAADMFGSVKKIISAFETRRQARPASLPPPLPSSLNSSISSSPVSASSPSTSLGSPSSPSSSSSSSVLSKVSPLNSPVNHEPRPYPLRASSPGKPCPGSNSCSSPSAKRLARLSVPPAAEPIMSPFHTTSPPYPQRTAEKVVMRERWKDGGREGTGGSVLRDVPRMRVRDSWPIGQQQFGERWSRYTQTVPLRADRHTQTLSISAGPKSTSAICRKSASASGGSGNSAIAIDNKIEQAMDLVKTHLMLAVREEVELLREQIKELTEKNAQLERENYILKALRDRH